MPPPRSPRQPQRCLTTLYWMLTVLAGTMVYLTSFVLLGYAGFFALGCAMEYLVLVWFGEVGRALRSPLLGLCHCRGLGPVWMQVLRLRGGPVDWRGSTSSLTLAEFVCVAALASLWCLGTTTRSRFGRFMSSRIGAQCSSTTFALALWCTSRRLCCSVSRASSHLW